MPKGGCRGSGVETVKALLFMGAALWSGAAMAQSTPQPDWGLG
jgi:hypothetical protein